MGEVFLCLFCDTCRKSLNLLRAWVLFVGNIFTITYTQIFSDVGINCYSYECYNDISCKLSSNRISSDDI